MNFSHEKQTAAAMQVIPAASALCSHSYLIERERERDGCLYEILDPIGPHVDRRTAAAVKSRIILNRARSEDLSLILSELLKIFTKYRIHDVSESAAFDAESLTVGLRSLRWQQVA